MSLTTDTRPAVIDTAVDSVDTPDAPRVVEEPSRLPARTAALVLAGILGIAVASAVVVAQTGDPVVGAGRSSAVIDASESAHGSGTTVDTGSGAVVTPATLALPAAYGDALVLAHGLAGSVTTRDGSRAVRAFVATFNAPASADAVDVAHGTTAGIADAAGHPVTR
jgi:hypothetical protein